MLYRKISSLIEEHLKSDTSKILLIDGARQVGKTYIVRHVGKKLFENFRNSPLPETRAEFENRAMLFKMLNDFMQFIEIKQVFYKEFASEKKISV